MRDQDRGGAPRLEDAADVGTERAAQSGVERVEGLVEQHEVGIGSEGAGERHPLLLAAGELVRRAGLETRQADEVEHRAHPRGPPGTGEAEPDVVRHRQMREQRPLLWHEGDAAPVRREHGAGVDEAPPIERDGTRLRALETGDEAQQRGLAAARGAEQREDRAARDRQVDAAHHGNGAEGFLKRRQMKPACVHAAPAWRRRRPK